MTMRFSTMLNTIILCFLLGEGVFGDSDWSYHPTKHLQKGKKCTFFRFAFTGIFALQARDGLLKPIVVAVRIPRE